MAVGDADRNIMLCSGSQDYRTKAVLMYMNNFVFRVFIKKVIQSS